MYYTKCFHCKCFEKKEEGLHIEYFCTGFKVYLMFLRECNDECVYYKNKDV